MNRTDRENWSICRTQHGTPCLYTERGRSAIETRAPNHPPYCIKHGEELSWAYQLYGMSRRDARAAIDVYGIGRRA